jgi:hypothetical protein
MSAFGTKRTLAGFSRNPGQQRRAWLVNGSENQIFDE